MFISFKSIRPTICKCKRDRVRYFLNGSEPAELSVLPLELRYIFLSRPCDTSTREVPSPHMLSQCGFREVVSRELIEDSTCKLVIVIPPREHMTMVQLLVEIGEGLLGHAKAAIVHKTMLR